MRSDRRRGPAWGKLLAAALLIAALAAAWRYTPLSEYITAERVTGWARAMRGSSWAPVAVMLAYTPAAFVMFPRPLITLFTVIAFGPWLGFAYSMTGIIAAALATYYAGRVLRPGTVKRLAGDKLDDVTKALRRHGLLAMLAVRVVPAAPFVVEGIIAGAVRIKIWDYTFGTFLGMLPGVLATTVFGNEIAAALEDPSRINYWLVGAVVVAMIGLSWFVRRWFKNQGPGSI
ncbi:MAG: TVP38/TMEM64 family protein [Burkholderiales bacterium]